MSPRLHACTKPLSPSTNSSIDGILWYACQLFQFCAASSRWCRGRVSCTHISASVTKFGSQPGLGPDCLVAIDLKTESLMFPAEWAGLFLRWCTVLPEPGTQTCCQQCDAWPAASASSAELHRSIYCQLSVLARRKIIQCSRVSQLRKHQWLGERRPTAQKASSRDFASFPSQLATANKVSKNEVTRKVEYAYHLWKCTDAV